jgi:hypothetical protein
MVFEVEPSEGACVIGLYLAGGICVSIVFYPFRTPVLNCNHPVEISLSVINSSSGAGALVSSISMIFFVLSKCAISARLAGSTAGHIKFAKELPGSNAVVKCTIVIVSGFVFVRFLH